MARTQTEPMQTFGRVTIHRKPGDGNRRTIDTTYIVKCDGKPISTISAWSDEYRARAYALGYAQALDSANRTGLSDEAMAVLAGFAHLPTHEHQCIFAGGEVWDELERAFPRALFDARCAQDPDFYDPEAGT